MASYKVRMSIDATSPCQRKSVPDIQRSPCYEGDSEEGDDYRLLSSEKVNSTMDSFSHLPHSQHIRQVHSTKSNRHRGCIWGENEKVTLVVDSKRFIISPNLLIKHPNTMLGR